MENFGVIAFCFFALIQVLVADRPTDFIQPPTEFIQQSTNIVKQPQEFINTDPSELSNRPELQIINRCTTIPLKYDELLNNYVQTISGEATNNIETLENELQSQINELQQLATRYQREIASANPNAQNLQNFMSTAVTELEQSINEINANVFNRMANTSEVDLEERMATIEKYVRPAIIRLEQFCLVETKDILKNVLTEYETSLSL